MPSRSQRWQAALLFLVFMLGLLPGCSTAISPDHLQDDAMLLMIASQVRLAESLESESLASAHGQMSLRPVGIIADGKTANEVVGLIELYRKYQDKLETQKDAYTEQQYQYVQGELNGKLSQLEQQASSLTKRRRRRGFNPFKAIGRGIGKLAKGIGKGVKFVVVEGGKLAIHFVVDKVKTTIRDVFEGRVKSIIARFAGRFGPLSPWVEARLRRVLDRWWVGFRDRATGRARRYATQTAEALGQEPREEESQEDGPIYDDDDWFDEVWTDMEQLLILGGQNCQKTAIVELRRCLLDQAASGTSADDAINACEAIMKAIPKNDAGGSVNLTGQSIFLDADPNQVTITYPSAGGKISGDINFRRYEDVFGCTFTAKTKVEGQYDPATCTMQGEATIELHYDGYCVSVCGSGPASPRSCPYSKSGTTVWKATLEDGVLSGGIGDESCEPFCFGFRAPGYGIDP